LVFVSRTGNRIVTQVNLNFQNNYQATYPPKNCSGSENFTATIHFWASGMLIYFTTSYWLFNKRQVS